MPKNLFLTSNFYQVADAVTGHFSDPASWPVLFITTAAQAYPSHPWLDLDRTALTERGFSITDYDLKGRDEAQLEEAMQTTRIVFVAGGNTFYLLQEMQSSGFARVMEKYFAQGVAYIGSSAGSVVVGPDIEPVKDFDDPKAAPNLKSFQGLGWVDFVVLPHYNPEDPKEYDKVLKEFGEKDYKLELLHDIEFFHFTDEGKQKLSAP